MTVDSKKVHFTRINQEESLKRILQLKNQSGEIIVWLKNRAVRETYKVIEIISDQELKVYPIETKHLVNNEVLFKFDVGGQNYFSTGKLSQESSNGFYILEINNDFFKSERRSSYRLQVFPDYDVRISLEIKDNQNSTENNVVDFSTGLSQTGIFKNFLKLINREDKIGQNEYRVHDLSTTGISFIVGIHDKDYIRNQKDLTDIKITLDEEQYTIKKARVVYLIDYIQELRKGLKEYKVGLEFDNVTTSFDSRLGKKIAEILRKNEANEDFEDFIE